MSRVWLCQGSLAEQPFTVNKNIRLYSFEELCYYLYLNVESVEESFFNGMLCRWMEQELGKKDLADLLSQGLEQERNKSWCIKQVLKESGFYSSQEIAQALGTVKSMEDKSPAQRSKLRGDRFLLSGKFREALWEYRKALKEESDIFLRGRIWHNIGTLYAKQFLFAPAAECYKVAYEIGQQTDSSEAYLLALSCRDSQNPRQKGTMAEKIENVKKLRRSVNRAEYEAEMERLLLQLRTEYRKCE